MISKSTTLEISENTIMYAPAKDIITESLQKGQEIPIDGPHQPTEKYELIAPLETIAIANSTQGIIDIETVVYINSSHIVTSLNVYEKPDEENSGTIDLFIEFNKQVEEPTTNFIPYLVKFKIDDIEGLKAANLYLKSSNPRTSRGTVTTVKRPM